MAHRLTCLNTWFPGIGAVWKGVGTFRRDRFAGRKTSLGRGWSLSLDSLASLLSLGFQGVDEV